MGPGMFAMMLWIPLGMLFCIVVVAGVIWLLARWLNTKKTPTIPYTPQPQNPYQPYEQGYQAPPEAEIYQAGGQQYRSQEEQPQAQYPQEQEPPLQG